MMVIMNKFLILLIAGLLTACDSPYSSHYDKVKSALDRVDYDDGISQVEAKAIADAYLIHHGKYKGRATYAKIFDGEEEWLGQVIVVKSLATPVIVDLPPVVVDKASGEVSWALGPAINRIELDEVEQPTK